VRRARLAAAVGLATGVLLAAGARAEGPAPTDGSTSQPPGAGIPDLGTPAREPATSDSFSARLWDYLYRGASLEVGIGSRQADLKVTDKSTQATGRIVERHERAYFISYNTRPSFIGTTRFGYNFALNYTTFDMDRQEVAKNVYENLGTRVRGRVGYVVPTLFYQYGEHGPQGAYTRAGIGLGLGFAKFEGNIILDYPANQTPVSVSNGNYHLKFASSVYLEARYHNWGLTVVGAGPSYEDERYQYAITTLSVYFSYAHYF